MHFLLLPHQKKEKKKKRKTRDLRSGVPCRKGNASHVMKNTNIRGDKIQHRSAPLQGGLFWIYYCFLKHKTLVLRRSFCSQDPLPVHIILGEPKLCIYLSTSSTITVAVTRGPIVTAAALATSTWTMTTTSSIFSRPLWCLCPRSILRRHNTNRHLSSVGRSLVDRRMVFWLNSTHE